MHQISKCVYGNLSQKEVVPWSKTTTLEQNKMHNGCAWHFVYTCELNLSIQILNLRCFPKFEQI